MQALQSKQQFNAIWFGSVFIAMASAKANEDDSRQKEKFTGESWSRVFPHNGQVQTWKSFFSVCLKVFLLGSNNANHLFYLEGDLRLLRTKLPCYSNFNMIIKTCWSILSCILMLWVSSMKQAREGIKLERGKQKNLNVSSKNVSFQFSFHFMGFYAAIYIAWLLMLLQHIF